MDGLCQDDFCLTIFFVHFDPFLLEFQSLSGELVGVLLLLNSVRSKSLREETFKSPIKVNSRAIHFIEMAVMAGCFWA